MDTIIVPIEYRLSANRKIEMTPGQIEELLFSTIAVRVDDADRRVTEADLEEFVRKNVQIVFPQETLLIVGQQVINKEGGRSDLVAIDGIGNIVLIELKRDPGDMIARKEALEFQAIRYAANYARIADPQELVQKLFAPYIEKHRTEYPKQELTSAQLALEILTHYLDTNKINIQEFNQRQRIVLIASNYDEQTLSACAWLSKNKVDLRCLTISPIRHNQQHFLVVEQLIPPPPISDYFVEVAEPTFGGSRQTVSRSKGVKENLPRMPKLLEWGIIKPGDVVYISASPAERAQVVDARTVRYKGREMTFNEWGQTVTGWSAINIYEWTYLESSDRPLDELRRAKMEELETQSGNSVAIV